MRDDEPLIDEELTRPMRDVVLALRDEDDLPELWRARVRGELRRASASRRRRRTVGIAVAAALIVGASSMLLLGHAPASSQRAQTRSSAASPPPPSDAAQVRFTLEAKGEHHVALVGDFDGWAREGRPMRRSSDGRTWELDVALLPGRHAFAYLVDGVLRAAPGAARAVEDDFGVPSSVVVVASRGL